MCYCDYEPVEMYDDALRRACKPHTCHECNEPIQAGEFYLYATYYFDGSFNTYKRCARCEVVWKHIQRHEKCACIAFGMLADYISEGCGWGSQNASKIIGAYQREHRIERPNLARHYWRNRAAVRSLRQRANERAAYRSRRQAIWDKYDRKVFA